MQVNQYIQYYYNGKEIILQALFEIFIISAKFAKSALLILLIRA